MFLSKMLFDSSKTTVKKLVASGLKTKAQELLAIVKANPFQNPPPYEKLVGDLFKVDFEVTNAEELELEDGSVIFCFDASKDGSLNAARIVAEIESLLPLCEKYGVDYDGWGTFFEE